MPVMDYIRARVRQPDCLWAVFPDNNGSVFSPMNNQVFPVPGSATSGSTDVKDGLLTLQNVLCQSGTDGTFLFPSKTTTAPLITSNLYLAGMTPNHTVIMRMLIPSMTITDNIGIGFIAGAGAPLNGTYGTECIVEIDATSGDPSNPSPTINDIRVTGQVAVATHSENTADSYGSGVRCYKGYSSVDAGKKELFDKFITLALTCDQTTRRGNLYLNGDLVASTSQWSDTRDELSVGQPVDNSYRSCRFGIGNNNNNYKTSNCHALFEYGAVFNTVMTPDEIKLISEN